MLKAAAVVVLYNPDAIILKNIKTYINQVAKLFVIDNSDKINSPLVEKIRLLKNAEYICNNSNVGIAAALNIGAKRAIEEGYKFLLTMDQDSKASPEMVMSLMEIINSSNECGIAAAEHVNPEFQQEPKEKITMEVLFTMTSGNLVNLSAYQKAGGYLEELFIDHVDHEFCLRLIKNGFKIIKTTKAIVYHKVGKSSKKKFFNHYLFPTNHPPLRLYYRTRNRFYIDNLYQKIFPEYVIEDRRNMKRELLEIFLYDSSKLSKMKMMLKGYIDYRKKRYGKL
ncbi:MAG: glycosyltransferase family 2 protein [Ignavibacteriaceae bacterium]